MWTSLDIDIKFDRPTNIRAQLDKIANGGKPKPSSGPRESSMGVGKRSSYLSREPLSQSSLPAESPPTAANEDTAPETPLDPASRFTALKSFYKTQLSNTSSSTDPTGLSSISGDFSYSSPASLARIMNLYSTTGSGSSTFQPLHKKKTKPPLMREALTVSEGLQIAPINPPTTTPTTPPSFSSTTTLSQRHFQTSPSNPSGNPNSRHITSLLPMPAPLATKRSKRCKACRHILVKPEVKPTSTRHRIRLVALSYIPSITFRPLLFSGEAGGGGIAGLLGREDILLTPGVPTQWLLTLRNPLFDAVRVSLGTPAVTPGKMGAGGGHRVTILCPQFEVGASGDLWDEALGERSKAGGGDGKGGEGGVAEAGKVYEWGRNWTTVVVEVVPVAVEKSTMRRRIGDDGVEEMIEKLSLDEDEDVLEISIRVRLEWRQGDLDGGTSSSKKVRLNEDEVDDGRRELAYWMVLGVGRVKT